MATFTPMDTKKWPELKIVADNISKWRGEMGWSQRDLAKLVDCSQPYVSAIEQCMTDPRGTMLIRFSRVFQRPVHHFFMKKPPKPPKSAGEPAE